MRAWLFVYPLSFSLFITFFCPSLFNLILPWKNITCLSIGDPCTNRKNATASLQSACRSSHRTARGSIPCPCPSTGPCPGGKGSTGSGGRGLALALESVDSKNKELQRQEFVRWWHVERQFDELYLIITIIWIFIYFYLNFKWSSGMSGAS